MNQKNRGDGESDSPFDLLLEEMTKTVPLASSSPPMDFKFDTLLKSNNKRKDNRIATTGQVEIFREDGSLLSNAVLRNISATGMAVEFYPVDVEPQTGVLISLAGRGGNFGRIQARVQWVKPVENHPSGHKQMGILLTETSEELNAKYAQYMKALTLVKR